MDSSLSISLSLANALSASGVWLKLEQEMLPSHRVASPTLSLVYQMVTRAITGVSASTVPYPDCPVEILGSIIRVSLPFYVWPSSMELTYSLSSNIEGEISDGVIVDTERELDVTFPMQNSVDMGTLFDITDYEWQTPCYGEDGAIISNRQVTSDGALLRVDQPVFGVLRVKGVQRGFRHIAHLDFDKTAEGAEALTEAVEDSGAEVETTSSGTVLNKITNVNADVTANWVNCLKPESTTLSLKIPKCALDILTVCGPEDYGGIIYGGRVIDTDEGALIPTVYFSTCTGKMITIRYE